jgi:hypothetical protein
LLWNGYAGDTRLPRFRYQVQNGSKFWKQSLQGTFLTRVVPRSSFLQAIALMENASPTSSMELLRISDLCVRDRAEPYMNPMSPDREYSLGIYKSPVAP